MRRTWKAVLALFVLASVYAAVWKFGLPFIPAAEYEVNEVTVHRRYLGFVWVPREKVRFTANLQELPLYNREGGATVREQFKADLKTLAVGDSSR